MTTHSELKTMTRFSNIFSAPIIFETFENYVFILLDMVKTQKKYEIFMLFFQVSKIGSDHNLTFFNSHQLKCFVN